ncbi:MAG: zinc-binding dehydrogenase [Pseudomonadota bacterium]
MVNTIPDTMRAAQYAEHGGTDLLKIAQARVPKYGETDALIRVRACALNGFDPMMLLGTTGLKVPFPMTPCGDFAGEIAALGDKVHGWSVGDRVSPYPILLGKGMMGETTPGAACEFVVVPAEALIAVPDGVSDADAAAMPCAYGTALRMVETRGQIKAGEKVLILGASGGVGVAAIQFAKRLGAYVIAGASDERKLSGLEAIGADETLNTSDREWRKTMIARHGRPAFFGESGGVDVIINYIGGPTWVDSLKCLAKGGRVLVCGASAGHDPKEDLRYIWSFEQTIVGSNGWSMEDQGELLARVDQGEFRPVIHELYPIEDLPRAMDDMIARTVIGKAVISI